jgi:hypothetical protein
MMTETPKTLSDGVPPAQIAAVQLEPDPLHVEGLTVKEAAAELGISEKTVRHRIKLHQLTARKIETPQGYQWRIYPDGVPSEEDMESDPLPVERDLEEDLEPDPLQVEPPAVLEVLRMLAARQTMIDQLQVELREASTVAAHWQARAVTAEEQARRAEEQVKLLMPPTDEPAPPAEPERRPWWKRLLG